MDNKRCTTNKIELRKIYENKMREFLKKQEKKNGQSKS